MRRELGRLLAPFNINADEAQGAAVLPPTIAAASTRRWGAGFTDGDLRSWSRQDEQCISLEPWRVAICGDYISVGDEATGMHACAVEAAALSGLEAGERVGSWLRKYAACAEGNFLEQK